MNASILLIDNYDSFTYNIVQYLMCLGVRPKVIKNDCANLEEILKIKYSHLIISPGPGNPQESGICKLLVKKFAAEGLPILGVCLGHQIIAEIYGARVIHAKEIFHGRVSEIENTGAGIFTHLPKKFKVTRYHSLIVESPLPESLIMTAWHQRSDGEREIMGLQHKVLPIYGVQFHPEAILTEFGMEVFKNFLNE